MERKLKNSRVQSTIGAVLGHQHRNFTVRLAIVAITLLSFLSFSHAKSRPLVQLLIWQPSPNHAIFALPQIKGETPEEAIQRYLRTSVTDIDIKSFGPQAGFLNDVKQDEWRFLNVKELQEKVILVAANRSGNHYLDDPKLSETLLEIKNVNKLAVIIPVGATINLERSKQSQFHKLLAKSFSDLVLLGGDDLSPTTYRQVSTYAKFYNEIRDKLELTLVRDFYKFGQGRILGICRGAQLLAVAFGDKIYQDIKNILGSPIEHIAATSGQPMFHKVTLLGAKDSTFAKLFGLDSQNMPQSMIWNSYHHQSVKLNPNGIFEATAVSEDGVVEAFISKDSRLIGIQAHFERADPSGWGKIFLSNFFSSSKSELQKKEKSAACHGLLKNI